MRIKTIILLFSLITCTTFSQSSFAPIGTIWNYWFTAHNGGYSGQKSLAYEKDTIINSLDLKLIKSNWYYTIVQPMPPISGSSKQYVFERNDSIFEFFSPDSLSLLYSFSMPIGDSINTNPSAGPATSYHLDSIGQKNICANTYEVLHYTSFDRSYDFNCTRQTTVVKDLGPIDDYLFLDGVPNCQMSIGSYSLLCINTGVCVYPEGADCFYLKQQTQKPISVEIKYYNEKLIFAQLFTGTINILDTQGKEIKSLKLFNQTEVDLSEFQLSGMHLVKFQTENDFSALKLFIDTK